MDSVNSRTSGAFTVTLDDDPLVGRIVSETLGIENIWFETSKELFEKVGEHHPVGALVDIHLDGECGLDLVPSLRKLWPNTAIIVMTADYSRGLVGQALAAGADDFVRKPLDPVEVMARLRARLEDLEDKQGQTLLRFEDVKLDTKHRMLYGPEGSRSISVREVSLISELLRANGSLVPKDEMKRHLWQNVSVSDNALDRKIFEVRRALKEVGSQVVLQSIYGVGLALRCLNTVDSDRV